MKCNRTEAIELIDTMFEANKYYLENGEYEECKVPYISGPPGIGKTSLVKNYAKSNNYKLHRITLTSLEYYELKGLLYPNENTKTVDIFPLNIFPQYDCLLFIDEINAADYSVQKVMLDLFQEREILGNKLSDNTMIITAGNKKEQVAEMYDLIEPLLDRCKEIELENSVDDILSYLYTVSKPMYKAFLCNKSILYKIVTNSEPVSLRGLTCVRYFVDKYHETKNERYRKAVRLYVGSELENILLDDVTDKPIVELLQSNDLVDQSLGLYELIATYKLYDDDFIIDILERVDKQAIMTAVLHCKANGLSKELSEFQQKYGNIVLKRLE